MLYSVAGLLPLKFGSGEIAPRQRASKANRSIAQAMPMMRRSLRISTSEAVMIRPAIAYAQAVEAPDKIDPLRSFYPRPRWSIRG
jgi:hypothetical protein